MSRKERGKSQSLRHGGHSVKLPGHVTNQHRLITRNKGNYDNVAKKSVKQEEKREKVARCSVNF